MTAPQGNSVSTWLVSLQEGHPQAAEEIWKRYHEKLVRLASKRLPQRLTRVTDGEDIAVSAFASFCEAVKGGRIPRLQDRDDLWKILTVITARKCYRAIEKARADKRSDLAMRGESVFDASPGDCGEARGLEQIVGAEPTPEFANEVADQLEYLLGLLPNEDMRSIALLKLEGYTNAEIAQRLNRLVRTVERKLFRIRSVWATMLDGSSIPKTSPPARGQGEGWALG